MKKHQKISRLITITIIGVFIPVIMAFAILPSASSAISGTPVSKTKIGSKLPGLSKNILFGPDDPPEISIDDVTVQEDTGVTVDAVFTVSLFEWYTGTVTVDYTTTNGTAIAPGDFISETGTVIFPSGTTTQAITITIQGDYLDETDEIFTVELGNQIPTTATIDTDPGVGTITDDDVAGVTVSSPSGVETTETGGFITFTVALDSEPTEVVTITLNVTDTTEGVVSVDWLEFTDANWDIAQDVTVTGLNDDVDDGNVAYTLELAVISDDPLYAAIDPDDISLTNLDDDAADVIVSSPSGTETTEAGGFITFTVALDSEPTEVVTVTLNVTDTTEGEVSEDWLEFTDDNWGTAQEVTVTGLNDSVEDGPVGYGVELAVISDDPLYASIDPNDISLTNLDNDAAEVIVSSPSGVETTEAGGFITFTVALDSEPTDVVTVTLNVTDPTEGVVSVDWLEFTDANWDIAQDVTVTGLNDDVDDGNVAYTLELAVTSDDPLYNVINPEDISLTNLDNDAAEVIVSSPSGVETTEAGGFITFTVALDSEPTEVVTVTLNVTDPTEGVVSVDWLEFTDDNWGTAQEVMVTGLNDFVEDGPVGYGVELAVISDDPLYATIDPDDISLTNLDDDTAGITVTPTTGLTTTETIGPDQADTFTVVLDSEPTAPVTITLSSSNVLEGTVAPDSLSFSASDWSDTQVVTITGVDDSVDDDDQDYQIITAAATSADGNYNGYNSADVPVTNIDDDTAGVTVYPTSGLVTTEAGITATFTIVLDSEPTRLVNIVPSSSETTEGQVPSTPLRFDDTDWNIPQQVTITGEDDNDLDGDQPYSIQFLVYSSDDKYELIDVDEVSVTNLDNEDAGISVYPQANLSTDESGGTDKFYVVLDALPTDPVTVTLRSSDESEGTIALTSLTFTPGDYSTPQRVTVTGVDDDIDDGDQPYTIFTDPATSDDDNYNGEDAADVSVTNTDDDQADIIVNPTSGLVTMESGTSDTFTVRLPKQPTANVTIMLSSSNELEGIVLPDSLFFTLTNWYLTQTITITGRDDPLDDGDVLYQIDMVADSSDLNYHNVNKAVPVTNLDNDNTPVAGPDTYITNEYTLTVTAPGVLGNDSDADGQNTMIAILDKDVDHGSLSLNDDGSFVYTSNFDLYGEDNFTYKASDGTNSSPSVQVKIFVDRISPTVYWVSPVGDGEQLNVTNEILQLEANADDNLEIERIRFYRWDPTILPTGSYVEIGNVYTPLYTIDFDTSVLNLGFNQIFVRVYDTAGNESERKSIWLFQEFTEFVYLPLMFR